MDRYVLVRNHIRDAQILSLPPEVTTEEEYEKHIELADEENQELLNEGYGWNNANYIQHFLGIKEGNSPSEVINEYAIDHDISSMLIQAYKI